MSSNPKRTSYFEEEEITVKPSTELIPDEYEHFGDSQEKFVLHTFVAPDELGIKQNLETDFLDTLQKVGFETGSTHKHNLNTDNFPKIINEISKGSKANDAGIILFFSGFIQSEKPGKQPKTQGNQLEIFNGSEQDSINIQQIWSRFDSHNCPALKNKPKIFIFALSTPETTVARDGKRYLSDHHAAYDTPAEADILVIYNNSTNGNEDFLENFCENIRLYGKTENIITLASYTMSKSPTLIISTLTRNFYFTASDLRGHHHIIDKHTKEIKTHIKEIKETLSQKPVKKEKHLFRDSFKFLRRAKPEVEGPHCSPSDSTTTSASTSNIPLSSTKPPIRENIDPPRSRHVSISEHDGGRASIRRKSEKRDKPIWKY